MFSLFVLLLTFIDSTHSITVKVPKNFINVTVGETIYLQCTFATNQPTTNLLVQWTFYSRSSISPQQVYFYQAGTAYISPQFKGRLTMLNQVNTTMNASISISNMQAADSGSYTCEAHNIPDIEGITSASVLVKVLEKPSVPYCAVHGTVEMGHLVTLTCHSEKGSPSPNYTWTKLQQGRSSRVLGQTDVTTGFMYIRNISEFEFGEYQCNASNVVGFATCSIVLHTELNGGAIAGVVIGAILGAVLIFLLVWFITHQLKKKKHKVSKENKQQSVKSVEYVVVPAKPIEDHGEEEA
ncbi:V-set and immunoglobulin domain-containing protein 1-like [Triplophysa dalaica]|uniref:V-set and immunoglobulin domain-containing protein 1-like n=1 Tax=Triplophysa dalaica TaxID=1582913 RepID=UPI0024DF6F93|nr:V-set and immunoglobulin domain-containing protein 1-like [Triplophysa dalaica]